MSLSWLDEYVTGIIDYCNSANITEIYDTLNIKIKKIDKDNPILRGNEAIYIRCYLDNEIVFIRDDLPSEYEKFVLAHELGHAILHTEINLAAYNSNLLVKGKYERQANYFALKLLNIELNNIDYEGYTIEQIARALYVSEDSLKHIT